MLWEAHVFHSLLSLSTGFSGKRLRNQVDLGLNVCLAITGMWHLRLSFCLSLFPIENRSDSSCGTQRVVMRTCGAQPEWSSGEERKLCSSEGAAGRILPLRLASCGMWGKLFYFSRPCFHDEGNNIPWPASSKLIEVVQTNDECLMNYNCYYFQLWGRNYHSSFAVSDPTPKRAFLPIIIMFKLF